MVAMLLHRGIRRRGYSTGDHHSEGVRPGETLAGQRIRRWRECGDAVLSAPGVRPCSVGPRLMPAPGVSAEHTRPDVNSGSTGPQPVARGVPTSSVSNRTRQCDHRSRADHRAAGFRSAARSGRPGALGTAAPSHGGSRQHTDPRYSGSRQHADPVGTADHSVQRTPTARGCCGTTDTAAQRILRHNGSRQHGGPAGTADLVGTGVPDRAERIRRTHPTGAGHVPPGHGC